MITIPDVVEKIIKQSPYLEDLLAQGIINYSALARQIKSQVEEQTFKNVQEGAIIMALKRLTINDKTNHYDAIKKAFKEAPDVIVRSNLSDITVRSSDFTGEHDKKILKLIDAKPETFFTISRSVFEATIICGKEAEEDILKLFEKKSIVARFNDLSSITIRLTKETTEIPGVYYMILRAMAWEGINLTEIVSTYTELTLVIQTKDVDKGFSIIKRLFT